MQHGAVESSVMHNPWYSATLLAFEACQVVMLRMTKMSSGGQGALDEASLMVSEKVAASWEAATTLMTGGSPAAVITGYRQHVAHNVDRLTTR